jgi:hypothetical protein
MVWHGLTEQRWEATRVHLPAPKPPSWRGVRVSRIGAVLRASGGASGPVPHGATSPPVWQSPDLAGGGSNRGKRPGLVKLGRAFLAPLHDRQKPRWDAYVGDGRFITAPKRASA